jgi:hypothetical protein
MTDDLTGASWNLESDIWRILELDMAYLYLLGTSFRCFVYIE